MTIRRTSALLLFFGLAAMPLRATEPATREQLERDGWKIGFAPPDRELAKALAQHIEVFEARLIDIEATQPAFGRTQLEEQATELAAKAVEYAALPERKADFEREFHKATKRITRIENDMRAAFFPRAIDLWRQDQLQERLETGEPLPGVNWPAGHERLAMHFSYLVSASFREGVISVSLTKPEAVTLGVPEGSDDSALPDELAEQTDAWISQLAGPYASLQPSFVRMAANLAIAKVVGSEIAADPNSQWIVAGLSSWAWRELVLGTVKPEGANRYATPVPLLQVPSAHSELLNLEQWPADDEAGHVERALQLFINIAEHHGKDAIPALMAEFWKLPPEQRTTTGLKEVYQQLWSEPLEARAPWRSLSPVP